MKLLTLNAHSLAEEAYPLKLLAFADAVLQERPDIIALQESSQTACGQEVPQHLLTGYVPCAETAVIRSDNHVCSAAGLLAERGLHYHWTWLPVKRGYDRYDEGLALMSRSPILETEIVQVSRVNDYHNWKTRQLLGIRTQHTPETWFYSVHFGWWDDPEEPFAAQWEKTNAHMQNRGNVWLMGDFNSPAEIRSEGYDLIRKSGWHDSHTLAKQRDGGVTVGGTIDGWRDRGGSSAAMRIDQIWCSREAEVSSSAVLFNGVRYPVVSDHYGVLIEYERRGI